MNFFTSDMHLGHRNIVEICSRPFPDVATMIDELIQRNNSMVTDRDDVWDLGDVAYRCSPWEVAESLKQLNGHRHILLGNHDKPLREAYKKGLLNDMVKTGKIEIIGGETAIYDKNLIIAKQLTIDGQRVILSHYSYRTWPSAFRGAIMLYGHSHGNLSDYYKSFDVGVDSHNFYPWSWLEIKAKMDQIGEGFQEE